MAKWYVDTSQTYDGDGTDPLGAASAGAAGAANSFLAIWTNTHTYATTIAAGDLIYVRTHDGTSDCSESISANSLCGLPAGVTVIFDDGSVWANAGQFTLDCGAASAGYYMGWKAGVPVLADGENRRLKISSSYTGAYWSGNFLYGGDSGTFVDGLDIETTADSIQTLSGTLGKGTFKDLRVTAPTVRSGNYYLIQPGTDRAFKFINPVFNFSHPTDATSAGSIFYMSNDGGTVEVFGGKIVGENIGASGPHVLDFPSLTTNRVLLQGFQLASGAQSLVKNAPPDPSLCDITITGAKSEFHAEYRHNGIADFAEGENFPYLNAVLPNAAAEGWSLRITPDNTDIDAPHYLPAIEKYYNQAAATKTVTLEFLINQQLHAGNLPYTSGSGSFSIGETVTGGTSGASATVVSDSGSVLAIKSVNGTFEPGETLTGGTSGSTATNTSVYEGIHRGRLAFTLRYQDNGTGAAKFLSTLDPHVPMAVSSSTWSNDTYGAATYDKYKISVTTPTAIKQGSIMSAMVMSTIKALDPAHFWFVDPDLGVA